MGWMTRILGATRMHLETGDRGARDRLLDEKNLAAFGESRHDVVRALEKRSSSGGWKRNVTTARIHGDGLRQF